MIQLVFDSYVKPTIKDSQRISRGLDATFELADIQPCTALPSIMDSFWESDVNKRKLIDCAYEYYQDHPIRRELTIVCSGYFVPTDDKWGKVPVKSTAEGFSDLEIQLSSFPHVSSRDWSGYADRC